MTLAERLNDAMTRYGIGNRELSRRTGINPGDISHYRNGHYEPKQGNIYLIAKALNVSPGWLMGLDLPENQALLDEQILALWKQLTPDQQQQAVEFLQHLIDNQKTEP